MSDLLTAAFTSAQPQWEVHRERVAGAEYLLHWGEYEDIDWFKGDRTSVVSCFYTRKGLIRKALLAQTMTKLWKKSGGELQPMPESFVLQLEVDQGRDQDSHCGHSPGDGVEMNKRQDQDLHFEGLDAAGSGVEVNQGKDKDSQYGDLHLASYHFSKGKGGARFEESMAAMLESIGFDVDSYRGGVGEHGDRWILKPSMTNQGKGIRLVNGWESLVSALEETDEIERAGGLVLQRYIEPLLLSGKKFHLRVFVLVVGDCTVFVHRQFLAIVSLEEYVMLDLSQTKAHLTNICHQNIQCEEDQAQCMRLFEEVAEELVDTGACVSAEDAKAKMKRAEEDVLELTKVTMDAVTKELTFQARPSGFELFGFDYLVDENWRVWLLEANAEPDLKMAGDRLQWVIDDMLREALQLVVDSHDHLDLKLAASEGEGRFVNISRKPEPVR